MTTGWKDFSGSWFYFYSDGSMATGWLQLDGRWYYLNSGGDMRTGLLYENGRYYIFAGDGHWANTADNIDMYNNARFCSSATPWLLVVDTAHCTVGVYYGSYNAWSAVRGMACSVGTDTTPTVKGEFTVGSKGYVFGHGYSCYYWTQFYGDYLFHSVKYNEGTSDIQDGRLGQHISHGCVRTPLKMLNGFRIIFLQEQRCMCTKVPSYQ